MCEDTVLNKIFRSKMKMKWAVWVTMKQGAFLFIWP
jgi:hypothetical protein